MIWKVCRGSKSAIGGAGCALHPIHVLMSLKGRVHTVQRPTFWAKTH